MKYRKLRVAWSVGWGVVALLFVALWVRSYTIHDVLKGTDLRGYEVTFESKNGRQQIVGMDLSILFGQRPVSRGPWFYLRCMSADMGEGILPWHFQLQTTPALMFQLTYPHWFIVVATTSLALLPWIRWSRRFSMRTLLVAMTLVAVLLGLIAWRG